MAKDTDKTSREHSDHPADFSQLADAFKDLPIQQLMSNPAAAFAAATAFGFGMATQMTDVFLRTMQAATTESGKQTDAAQADEKSEEPVAKTSSAKPAAPNVAKAKAAKAKAPVAKTKAAKASKTRAKAPVAKATKAAVKVDAPVEAVAPKKAAAKAPKAPAKSKSVAAKPKVAAKPTVVAKAKPAAAAKKTAAKADDLKQISGIGPKLEQVLNAKGIARFADIAGLSKARIDSLDDELGLSGRIGRDDWVGQARTLSGGKG